ncbi:peptide chain release factor 1 [Blattabacterium cuenoti]|uniref:peptide chain release factor 1 n=1 Tax=Blattabacterium cuenoti TaxID=1653831 RepID=UPI00163C91C8|nr:peptide chain release factor 1 [Blattabacterium cuenoti]
MNDKQLIEKLEKCKKEFISLHEETTKKSVLSNPKKYKILFKKYLNIEKILSLYKEYKKKNSSLKEANFILKNDLDEEMKKLAYEEKQNIISQLNSLKKKIHIFLIEKDKKKTYEDYGRNVLLEIRSGTGGSEACLFVEDILRMYTMYFKKIGWYYKPLHLQKGNIKGYKEIILEVDGEKEVYENLKFESGVHRVQRIPQTESQGRIHTSAITVAVLPKIENIKININFNEVKKDTFRSSGAGGQHVNKTESAVRLTHIPSKITVECQEERSQHKNFEKAIRILKSRLYRSKIDKILKNRSMERKSLVLTGDRSVKIRTYNYPKNRVTDHRIKKSMYNLTNFMNGNIQEMIDHLKHFEYNQSFQ